MGGVRDRGVSLHFLLIIGSGLELTGFIAGRRRLDDVMRMEQGCLVDGFNRIQILSSVSSILHQKCGH